MLGYVVTAKILASLKLGKKIKMNRYELNNINTISIFIVYYFELINSIKSSAIICCAISV